MLQFLASEAMAALRIPTTRSLCVISTGELVVRQWYDEIGSERVQREPGAVGTRVASSFLRFGQMELFYQRGDAELLIELAQHALEREFSSVQGETLAEKYVAMFDEICSRQGTLIAEWLRVGYCQVSEILSHALASSHSHSRPLQGRSLHHFVCTGEHELRQLRSQRHYT